MTINKTNRIGATTLSLRPHHEDDARAEDNHVEPPRSRLVIAAPQPRTQAGLHIEPTRTRPHANFLTQYIDQHMLWPHAPHRKDRQRQRATRAYIDADMLPEVLADALRLHPVDKKL